MMIGSSTCLLERPIAHRRLQYMYSQNLADNIIEKIGAKFLRRTYDNSENNMCGVTLLYNNITGSTAMNLEQLRNLDKLYDIRHLKEDWNGYGSKCISESVIEMSEFIIKNIYNQPQMYPTGRSSIQMQFELEDRSYLEFEIFEEKVVCMKVPQRIYKNASFEVMHGVNMELINKIVKEFYE